MIFDWSISPIKYQYKNDFIFKFDLELTNQPWKMFSKVDDYSLDTEPPNIHSVILAELIIPEKWKNAQGLLNEIYHQVLIRNHPLSDIDNSNNPYSSIKVLRYFSDFIELSQSLYTAEQWVILAEIWDKLYDSIEVHISKYGLIQLADVIKIFLRTVPEVMPPTPSIKALGMTVLLYNALTKRMPNSTQKILLSILIFQYLQGVSQSILIEVPEFIDALKDQSKLLKSKIRDPKLLDRFCQASQFVEEV